MDDLSRLPALLEIARRALDIEDRVIERREHAEALRSAFKWHKRTLGKNEYEMIARDTPEWEALMAATAVEFADVEKAKRAEYNARRRLQTAIRAFRQPTRTDA